MSQKYWWVEVDPVSNENLFRILNDLGYVGDYTEVERVDNRKCTRIVIEIPSWLVKSLKKSSAQDTQGIFNYKFFESELHDGVIHLAEFVKMKSISPNVKRAESDLRQHLLKRSSRNR